MQRLPLSRRAFAFVDDKDAPRLAKFKWSLKPCKSGGPYGITNVKVNGTWHQEYLQRMILDAPPDKDVIFLTHDTLDCRRQNLRVVDKTEARRHHRVRRDSYTKLKGISLDPMSGRYSAQIVLNGRLKILGSFDDVEQAKRVYDRAVKRHYGDYAPLHYPEGYHASAKKRPPRPIPPPQRRRRSSNPDALTPLLNAKRAESSMED